MKKWILILLSIFLLIIDNSLMPFFAIKGSYPSLLFIFSIAYSIITNRKEAVIIGILSGVLQDIFFSQVLGLNALINMLLCFLSAIIGENIYKEKRLIPTISVTVMYILKIFIIGIIFKLINKTLNIEIGLYTSIYSAVIMFIVYKFILLICNKDNKQKSWRR